jgi:hypothetical protein
MRIHDCLACAKAILSWFGPLRQEICRQAAESNAAQCPDDFSLPRKLDGLLGHKLPAQIAIGKKVGLEQRLDMSGLESARKLIEGCSLNVIGSE